MQGQEKALTLRRFPHHPRAAQGLVSCQHVAEANFLMFSLFSLTAARVMGKSNRFGQQDFSVTGPTRCRVHMATNDEEMTPCFGP
jgi:hypothetical protein